MPSRTQASLSWGIATLLGVTAERDALQARGITAAEPGAEHERRAWPANGSED